MSNPAGACEVARSTGEIEGRLPFFAGNAHNIDDVARQLESICDRITGPTPSALSTACDDVKEPRPDTVIDQLDRSTSSTQLAMERLQHAANRLRELV